MFSMRTIPECMCIHVPFRDQFAIVLCNFREHSAEVSLKNLAQHNTELILNNYTDAPEQLSEDIA